MEAFLPRVGNPADGFIRRRIDRRHPRVIARTHRRRATLLFESENEPVEHGPLTERELEVLGLLARGLANKQIAVELGISEHTVKFHVSSIYTKLNVTNRTEAVRAGLRGGWIAL